MYWRQLRKSLALTVTLIGLLCLVSNASAQVIVNNQNQISPAVTCSNGQVITYNTTTGQWDTCAVNGAGADIGGTIADTQVAFGTGADTIGGDNDFTWADPFVLFTAAKGLSFAGAVSPTTIVGGTLDTQSSLIINNTTDGYVRLSFPQFTDFNSSSAGICITPDSYASTTCFDTADVGSGVQGRLYFSGPHFQVENTNTDLTTADVVNNTFTATVNPAANATKDLTGLRSTIAFNDSDDAKDLWAIIGRITTAGTGDILEGVGNLNTLDHSGSGVITRYFGSYNFVRNSSTGTITEAAAYWAAPPANSGGGTYTSYTGFYSTDIAGLNITNPYYDWRDSRGVLATKEEFSQARMALYDPNFTKYTYGLADYQRGVFGRFGITGTYGTTSEYYSGYEVGGTGVLGPWNLLGTEIRTMSIPGTYSPLRSLKYNTSANCADSAGDAACGAAPSGSVVVDAADTNTVVSTTAVTANSQIILQVDSSLGTRLGVTCNTQDPGTFDARVTARTAATSFTITLDVGPTTNPLCLNYWIIN